MKNIGILFSQYLAGQNSTLDIHGLEVVSPASNGQPVKWLTAAFKRFVTSAILPGHIYQIIYAITLSDLEVYITNEDDVSRSDVVEKIPHKLLTVFFSSLVLHGSSYKSAY